MDYIQAMLGQDARRAPAWLYVQNQGNGIVSFVGASKMDEAIHPLRYDSERTHQYIHGEVILRPVSIVATDALRGQGLDGLVTGYHDLDAMLANGERIK